MGLSFSGNSGRSPATPHEKLKENFLPKNAAIDMTSAGIQHQDQALGRLRRGLKIEAAVDQRKDSKPVVKFW